MSFLIIATKTTESSAFTRILKILRKNVRHHALLVQKMFKIQNGLIHIVFN